MKTDIKETKDGYIIDIDLPGFTKENIDLSLNNGYLNISAKCDKNNNEDNERYIRQERFYGECSRSFYVGDEIKEENIKAEFKNGILKIDVPKLDENKKLNEPKKININ
jgi:HSP20 family molecular chaperone IbpA